MARNARTVGVNVYRLRKSGEGNQSDAQHYDCLHRSFAKAFYPNRVHASGYTTRS